MSAPMDQPWEAVVVGVALFGTMAAYALFAGADFGGGIWDLLAGTTEQGKQPRAEIDRSVTPVWEGNQVWIVLGIVFVWTAFPTAFAAIMTSLFVPLSLSLLGILLRGIGFAFRHEAERLRTQQFSGVLFAASSFLAPFFLGTAIGAVTTGKVRTDRAGDVSSAWFTPTAMMTGALFVASCAYISGVYLIGDAHHRDNEEMVRYFSRRTAIAGAITGGLAAVNMVLMHGSAPYVFHRLTGPALPLVGLSVVGGLAAFVLILLRRIWLLRISAAIAVVSVVAAWGVAQYPYLLPTSLSLRNGSAPSASLEAEFVVIGMAAVFVAPAFAYLYWLQQRGQLAVTEASNELRQAVALENADGVHRAGLSPAGGLAAAAVVGAAAVGLARESVGQLKRLRRERVYGPGIRKGPRRRD
jgi:cytochrome bd ubiquinol oxidase subunit II